MTQTIAKEYRGLERSRWLRQLNIRALQLLRLFHKSFCVRLSKMPPSYFAGGVKQEFGDSGYVTAILASVRDQQIIAADHFGFAIGKQRKCEIGLAAQLP